MFGVPISVKFLGKSSHQTYLGACCSIIIGPTLFIIIIYLTIFFNYESEDIIRMSTTIFPISNPSDGMMLNNPEQRKSNFNFELHVNDAEFDNDDNPYGRWVYHMYTNMDSLNDTD